MDKTVDISSTFLQNTGLMTFTTKRRIYREYQDLVHARQCLRTVRELAKKYGVTRQRVYQIVTEVGRKRGEQNTNENQK